MSGAANKYPHIKGIHTLSGKEKSQALRVLCEACDTSPNLNPVYNNRIYNVSS